MKISRKLVKNLTIFGIVVASAAFGCLSGATGTPAKKTPHLALVMDASGSMDGERWQKGIQAALRSLENPNEDVKVKVWAFATYASVWPFNWKNLPDKRVTDRAVKWLENVGAQGSTLPIPALMSALAEKKEPLYVVMITDGDMSCGSKELAAAVALAQSRRKTPACLSVILIDGKKSESLKKLATKWRGAYVESK
jgi:uncharacterized protein with von Willebrand factor type A (vWA) domain